MFHRLLRLPDEVRAAADVSSLRMVLHGAAPCPVAVKQAIIEWWGPVLIEYYAATEGTGTFVTSAEWLERPGTVGKPPTPDHVRILDPVSDEPLPTGEVGTVYLKAPAVGPVRLLRRPRQDRRQLPGRPLHDGRRGLPRRGRLPVPHRPQRGPDHLRAA